MHRRDLARVLGGAAIAPCIQPVVASAVQPAPADTTGAAATLPRPKVGMLVYPDMIMQDLVGPLTMLSIAMVDVHLIWKDLSPVPTETGLTIAPNTTLAACPATLDVLFVPGGLKGTVALMHDPTVLGFLADRGSRARYVTSVCTGSLLLGMAGLLRGYRATSHWYVRDLLPLLGAIEATDRVVIDRNRITGGGVTAGLDFGLTLVAVLRGEATARLVQLVLEYAPKPPFDAGEPETAGPALTQAVLARRQPLIDAARTAARDAHG